MPSLQGEFKSKAAAQAAITALTAAGVARDHIRLWNIIPDRESHHSDAGVVGGAMVGGLLGGALGIGAGAAVGAAFSDAYGAEEHLPDPTGVRLVVDIDPVGPDIASLLRVAGAANVRWT